MSKKPKKVRVLSLSSLIFTFFILTVSFLYLHNLTQDIYGGDVGDLATASIVAGVAHPPGYPLFMILGYILSHLPLMLLPVSKVGLVSVLSSLGSLILFKKIVNHFTKNNYFQILSTAILSFTYLFWLYSEVPEVFALNIFFVLLVVFFVMKFYATERFWGLAGVFLAYGFGLTNHLTVLLTAPFFISVLVARRKAFFSFKYRLLILPIFFTIGLLPYLYIPIASSYHPVVNWDNVHSLNSFFQLVLRRDYGTFSAGPFPAAVAETKLVLEKAYFDSLFKSLTVPAILICITGIFWGLRKQKTISIGLILSILLSGPFFIVYAGFPIVSLFVLGAAERFYLLSQILLLLFLPLGFEALYAFFRHFFSKKIYAHIILYVFVLIPVLLFFLNFSKTDLSKTRIGTNFAIDYLNYLPKNSLLLASGDTRTFNAWYVHYVLHVRPDVKIVQIGNFGTIDPYFEAEYEKTKEETQGKEADIFLNTVLTIEKSRPVFSMVEIKVPQKEYKWLQTGFALQLFTTKNLPTRDEYSRMVHRNLQGMHIPYWDSLLPSEHSLILLNIPSYYSGMANAIGDTFAKQYMDFQSALFYYNRAIDIDPSETSAFYGLSKIAGSEKKCDESEKYISQAIAIFPVAPEYYIQWYKIALDCLHDSKKADRISKIYQNKFNEKITDALKRAEK